jgi:hypothetical protein
MMKTTDVLAPDIAGVAVNDAASFFRFEVPQDELEQFAADWNVSLWQSYDAWAAAVDNPAYATELALDPGRTANVKVHRGFYRPVATYTQLSE